MGVVVEGGTVLRRLALEALSPVWPSSTCSDPSTSIELERIDARKLLMLREGLPAKATALEMASSHSSLATCEGARILSRYPERDVMENSRDASLL